jgi:hypothetical protein
MLACAGALRWQSGRLLLRLDPPQAVRERDRVSAPPLERAETLKAEILVPVKRLGSDRVHFALVMPDTVRAGTHFGAACDYVEAPIAAFCSATLRGRLIVIPPESLDSWKRSGKVCTACKLIARLALAEVTASPH